MALILGLAMCLSAADAPTASPPGADTHPAEVFLEAARAYDAADYDKAIRLYAQLLDHDAVDKGTVAYNLGNSHLRRGEIGAAIAAYRRALAERPRDSDIAANLAFARKSGKDAIAPVEPSPILRTLFVWHHGLSVSELTLLAVCANAALWLCLIVRLWRRPEWLAWVTGACALTTLTLGSSLTLRVVAPERIAVVSAPQITVHSGTHDDALVLFKLHDGAEARVVERDGTWVRIRLSDGKQGWARQDDILEVRL